MKRVIPIVLAAALPFAYGTESMGEDGDTERVEPARLSIDNAIWLNDRAPLHGHGL